MNRRSMPPSKPPARRSADNSGRSPHAPGAPTSRNDTDLPLPHERDESSDGVTSAKPDPVMKQAHEDLASGQVDTDLRSTPGLDAQRRRKLVDGGKRGSDA